MHNETFCIVSNLIWCKCIVWKLIRRRSFSMGELPSWFSSEFRVGFYETTNVSSLLRHFSKKKSRKMIKTWPVNKMRVPSGIYLMCKWQEMVHMKGIRYHLVYLLSSGLKDPSIEVEIFISLDSRWLRKLKLSSVKTVTDINNGWFAPSFLEAASVKFCLQEDPSVCANCGRRNCI